MKWKTNDFAPSYLLLSIDGSSSEAGTREFCEKDDRRRVAERNEQARCSTKLDAGLPFCRTLSGHSQLQFKSAAADHEFRIEAMASVGRLKGVRVSPKRYVSRIAVALAMDGVPRLITWLMRAMIR